MPSNRSVSEAPITQFVNCRILKDHRLQREDLWVREGKILNPEKLFFDEEGFADTQVDCQDRIIAPGFIDVQINGVHLEGPFISLEKKGAHPEQYLRSFQNGGTRDLLDTYGHLDNVGIVTLAPELPNSREVIRELVQRGITVSLGLVLVTDAITAMGLPPGRHTLGQQVIEIDGLNAYVAEIRYCSLAPFCRRSSILFLLFSPPQGTKTLSGSIATMDMCVRHFRQASGCTVESALEAASLHPAQLLGLSHQKGTLDYGTDADFVLLDDALNVRSTYIAGEQVWEK
ncbi:NAGA deacetylase, partial [Amia calva]|nr:NAGA deacetylase [Amia calva]